MSRLSLRASPSLKSLPKRSSPGTCDSARVVHCLASDPSFTCHNKTQENAFINEPPLPLPPVACFSTRALTKRLIMTVHTSSWLLHSIKYKKNCRFRLLTLIANSFTRWISEHLFLVTLMQVFIQIAINLNKYW